VTDPREQLRRYLEQRRELGERELVLDQLSVEDALRIVGGARPAARTERPAESRPPEAPADITTPEESSPNDWRETLRAAGASPRQSEVKPARSEGIPASTPEVGGQLAPTGIVVGASSRELFGAGGPSLESLDDYFIAQKKIVVIAVMGCNLLVIVGIVLLHGAAAMTTCRSMAIGSTRFDYCVAYSVSSASAGFSMTRLPR